MKELTQVNLTNLDKVLYPGLGVTKSKVIEHYIRAAPRILDFLKDRPLVLNRFPDGVDEEGFYEKDAPQGKPAWVETFNKYSKTAERTIKYVVCNNLDTLIWLANLAAIEINVMFSLTSAYDRPDMAFIDIDPEPPADMDDAVAAAISVKESLDGYGLTSFVKTSGKKGLHILLPLKPIYSFKQTRDFVHQIGIVIAKSSDKIVSEFSQGRDRNTVFIDYTMNAAGKTMIAPYSLRANSLATVSTPLSWKEVRKGLRAEKLNIESALKRKKDPWEGILKTRQKLEVK